MSECSRDLLALYIGGDLPEFQEGKLRLHLEQCEECRQYSERLEQSQSLLKQHRRETATPAALTEMRMTVLSRIRERRDVLGWAVKLERFLLLGFRRPTYAVTGFAFLTIVSLSLLGQIRQNPMEAGTSPAMFLGNDTLLRPNNYREWIFVGSSLGLNTNGSGRSGDRGHEMFHNTYIDPAAYRSFATTGEFPEGTVMVMETAAIEKRVDAGIQGTYAREFVSLEASVKDSRFAGGWGYFNFTDNSGKLTDRARVLPEETGCRSCHQTRAETDHVFTQFYPVLNSIVTKS